ncbi:hypothetical protein ACFZAM_31675 [Streptomyces sp. NPDC008079]|uniref:hypothetical protein n=1 Tax=Streptomyces sp. NPDC008079 TaxID=3364806 RepID=UPI0036E2B603
MPQIWMTFRTHVSVRRSTWNTPLDDTPAELRSILLAALHDDPLVSDVGALLRARPCALYGTEVNFDVEIRTEVELHTGEWEFTYRNGDSQQKITDGISGRIENLFASALRASGVDARVTTSWDTVKTVPSTRLSLVFAPADKAADGVPETSVLDTRLRRLLTRPDVLRWRENVMARVPDGIAHLVLEDASRDTGMWPVYTFLTFHGEYRLLQSKLGAL